MFKISFNKTLISSLETEKEAISLALNLHNVSNIPHNIVVAIEDEDIMYFIQK